MSSLIYGAIGIFLIIYVSLHLLKALGKTFLGCLSSSFSEMDRKDIRTNREIFKDMENVGRSVKEIFEDMSEKKK